jgi:hypothetical protein
MRLELHGSWWVGDDDERLGESVCLPGVTRIRNGWCENGEDDRTDRLRVDVNVWRMEYDRCGIEKGEDVVYYCGEKMGATTAGEVLGEAETLKWREGTGE